MTLPNYIIIQYNFHIYYFPLQVNNSTRKFISLHEKCDMFTTISHILGQGFQFSSSLWLENKTETEM